MDIRRVVGRNLRRLRIERGLSLRALAALADVDLSFLSQLENGKRSATVTLLDQVARALRCPIVEFFVHGRAKAPKPLPRGRRPG